MASSTRRSRKAPKTLIGAAALLALIGLTVLVAREGFAAGATPGNRIVNALVLSMLALTVMAGPALAYRLCRSASRRWFGIVVGVICAAALTASVVHVVASEPGQPLVDVLAQLGRTYAPAPALVSSQAPGGPEKDESELKRVVAERAALYFIPTSEAAIAAARSEFIAVNAAYDAQCGDKSVEKCGELSNELAAKRNVFLGAVRNRNATLRAAQLDAEAAAIRARLGLVPPVAAKPPPAAEEPAHRAPVPPERPASQQGVMMLAGEIAVAGALILWSLPGEPSSPAPVQPVVGYTRPRGRSRLPASEDDLTYFLHDCMSRASGARAPLPALYPRFLDWCDEQGLAPLPPRKFSQAVVKCCADAQIEVRQVGSDIYCLDVKLAPSHHLH